MKKLIVTQSLIKDLEEYKKGIECGNLMQHKYVEGNFLPPNDTMNKGSYFEFKATGALPKNGIEPEPVTLVKGGLNSDYRRALAQSNKFKDLCEQMGIEIISTQEKKVRNGLEGTRDIHFRWTKGERKGEEGTIDLKYSAGIHDKWDKYGWRGLIEGDEEHKGYKVQMQNHKRQAIQYNYVFEMPFYYWVFSSSTGAETSGENIFLEMIIDEDETEMHLTVANQTRKEFEMLALTGFEPRPEYNKCAECPLLENCDDAHTTPVPRKIKVTTI